MDARRAWFLRRARRHGEPAPIRCVAFDFEGTLVQCNGARTRACFDAVASIPDGHWILAEIVRESRHRSYAALFAEVARRVAGGRDAAAMAAHILGRFTAINARRTAMCPGVPGVEIMLRNLCERRIPLYVLSSTPQPDLRKLVRARIFPVPFQGVLGGPVTKRAHLANILAEHALLPEELVMIGDQSADRAAARAAGCYFVAVAGDEASAFAGDAAAIRDYSQLPPRLEQLSTTRPYARPRLVAGGAG